MDHFAAAEEQLAAQRLRQKLDEVNVAAQTNLAPIQDHVNFTLQKAYFKCAYECFDRSRRQEEISNCVENCSIPLANVQQTFENEMAKFQVIMMSHHLIFNLLCKRHEVEPWCNEETVHLPSLVTWRSLIQILEKLNRSLMVCQDKYEAAKLQQKTGAMNDMVSCADQSIQESIKMLPHLTNKLKASFGISDSGSL